MTIQTQESKMNKALKPETQTLDKERVDFCIARLLEWVNYLYVERNLSRQTCESYKRQVSYFFDYLFNRNVDDIKKINNELVRDYIESLLERDIEHSSICCFVSALRSFGKYLARDCKIKNKFMLVEYPNTERHVSVVLSKDEAESLVTAPMMADVERLRDWAIFEMLYATGIRVSELCHLKNKDLYVSDRTLRVNLGKGAKDRLVPVGQWALKALAAYSSFKTKAQLLPDEPMFLNDAGMQFNRGFVEHIIKKYAKKMGISKKIHPHTFRTTFATHLLENGAGLEHIRELLGHEDMSSMQRYTPLSMGFLKKQHARLQDERYKAGNHLIIDTREKIEDKLIEAKEGKKLTLGEVTELETEIKWLKKQVDPKEQEAEKRESEDLSARLKAAQEEESKNPTISLREAAGILGISIGIARIWAQRKKIPGNHDVSTGWTFKKNVILSIKEQGISKKAVLKEKMNINPGETYLRVREIRGAGFPLSGGRFLSKLAKSGLLRHKIIGKYNRYYYCLEDIKNIFLDPPGWLRNRLIWSDDARERFYKWDGRQCVTKGKANTNTTETFLSGDEIRKAGLLPFTNNTFIALAKAGLLRCKIIERGKYHTNFYCLEQIKELLSNPPAWLKKRLKWSEACRSW